MEADGDRFWRYEGRHSMAWHLRDLAFTDLSLSVLFQAGVKKSNSTIFQLTNFNENGVGVYLGNEGETRRRLN